MNDIPSPETPVLDDRRLLAFSVQLQSASNIQSLLRITADEIRTSVGFQSSWISVFDLDKGQLRFLAVDGDEDHERDFWARAMVIPIAGDPYLERLVAATNPIVIEDAQVHPDVNRAVVEANGNRTIVNVPMHLIGQPYGALGLGTFGDEGVRVPTEAQLQYLVRVASQVTLASARIVYLRQRANAVAERARVERLNSRRKQLESVGQLAAGVAHDFNNLLTVIHASAAFLRRDEDDFERAKDLEEIVDAATRAAALSRRLLALGRTNAMRLESLHMDKELPRLVDMLKRVIPATIDVELRLSSKLPLVFADASQIEQVIINLCLNARDAMPDGGRLAITAESTYFDSGFAALHPWAVPGDYVQINVTDTGHGMSPEVEKRVFEPFFTTKAEGDGTGLGLAVSNEIAEQHGGVLNVYSEERIGSTFKLYLPVAEETQSNAVQKSMEAPHGGSERVLVADDEGDVRNAVNQILSTAGYDVTLVSDGAEAVKTAKTNRFDLVLLDAIMPEMGGQAAYQEIRASLPDARVLFSSGYGADEVKARFLAAPDAAFLPKPFSPEGLLRAVRTLLDDGP